MGGRTNINLKSRMIRLIGDGLNLLLNDFFLVIYFGDKTCNLKFKTPNKKVLNF
jgi:hypothetical protein